MSVLELAKRAYSRIQAERDGTAESGQFHDTGYERNEINEIIVPMLTTPPYLLATDRAGLDMVAAALDDTVVVGLDLETTGLNPRTDRVRLLGMALDTV